MKSPPRIVLVGGAVVAIVLAIAVSQFLPAKAQSVAVAALPAQTHIHGLAVDRQDPNYLLIATHHGLFRAGPDGNAERISVVQDFMGFNPHPSDPVTLYASGHSQSGNLGFIASTDGGSTWENVAPGVEGPVDFHQMAVSTADPKVIYGAYGVLQVSTDSGRTWSVAGPLPERLIDLAATAADARKLYAATESGLLVSRDAGASWEMVVAGAPVSMVEVGPGGTIYAFVLGRGLVSSVEDPLDVQTLSGDWGDRFLLHLAIDGGNPARLFGATQEGTVLASADGGKTWKTFGK